MQYTYLVRTGLFICLLSIVQSTLSVAQTAVHPVGQPATKASVSIYPNPTSDFIHIETDMLVYQVVLFDNVGNPVVNEVVLDQTPFQVPVSQLEAGFYILRVSGSTSTLTKRIQIR